MHFRDAVLRVPDVEALPLLWAASCLARTWSAYCWEPVPESPDHLLEVLGQCAEAQLDKDDPLSIHFLAIAAAHIWRSVPTNRQVAMAVYLFAVIEEIMEEDC